MKKEYLLNNELLQLVKRFRLAIDKAKENSEFADDILFCDFPKGCCGDTSNMLACYLQKYNYETIYVCGLKGDQSHAWLVLMDKNVNKPERKFFEFDDDIRDVLNLYSGNKYNEPIDIGRYEAENVENGLIIDITADQFYEMKNVHIYVDYMDSFHRDFEFRFAYEFNGIETRRLEMLYRKISYYL